MTQKTVAEILVETLIAAGVTRIYGVVPLRSDYLMLLLCSVTPQYPMNQD
jgi:hypothetical protein